MSVKFIRGIFILFIIIMFLIIGVPGLIGTRDELSEEEKQTAMILQSMEQQDKKEINKEIAAARKKVQYENMTEKEAIRLRFQSAALIGDSVSEGMIGYHVLHRENAFCKRGLRIDNCREYLNEALTTNPEVIFFQFGINDMEYYRSKVNRFIQAYKEQIDYVRKNDQSIQIYVNAILPIEDFAIKKTPDYGYYEKYNQALKQMCEEMNCGYIDNAFLLKQMKKPLEQDGVHPRARYYPLWAENMLKEAGL